MASIRHGYGTLTNGDRHIQNNSPIFRHFVRQTMVQYLIKAWDLHRKTFKHVRSWSTVNLDVSAKGNISFSIESCANLSSTYDLDALEANEKGTQENNYC